jgi:ATP-binding cassette, subfamily B, bacterial
MGGIINKVKQININKTYIKWLAKYTKPYLPKIIFLLVVDILASLATVYLAVLSKEIIDSALGGTIPRNAVFIYIMLVLLSIGINALNSLISVVLDEKFSFGIRKQIYHKIINSKWMDVTKYHTGDLMTRLTSDAGNVANGIIYTLPTIINLTFQLGITFVVLYYYEPMLAIYALLIAPAAAIVSFFLGRVLKKLQIRVQETESAYRSFLQESLANLLIVKAFGNEDYSTKRLTQLRDERFFWVKKRNLVSVISSMVMSLVFQMGYILAFTYGSYKISLGEITFGTMTIFLTLVNRIQSPIMELARNIPKIVSLMASSGRIIELQDIPEEVKNPVNIESSQVGVAIKGIRFGYDDDDLFQEASTEIRPGEFVAIVGESGIGKTTLVRLLMAFIDIEEGDIDFYNQQHQTESANAGAREFISYVPQGNTLFSGSIRDNIKMGKQDASDEEIEEVLKLAAADHFVRELPKGIDTRIGEKGHGISEGQAQRIAIARSLIKKAPFLILDEATSSLDDETELEVLKGILKSEPRPTCLLITHRHSVLDYCDREIRINNKKLVIRDLVK